MRAFFGIAGTKSAQPLAKTTPTLVLLHKYELTNPWYCESPHMLGPLVQKIFTESAGDWKRFRFGFQPPQPYL